MFSLNREQHYKITMDMEDNIFLHYFSFKKLKYHFGKIHVYRHNTGNIST